MGASRKSRREAGQPDSRLRDLAELINESGHSVFSPSGSAMWLNCSGSLIANMMVDDAPTFAAVEGTVAHGIAEQWLKSGEYPQHLIGTVEVVEEKGIRFEISVTKVMLQYIQEYVDWCSDLPGDHYVEIRVDFSEYTPIPNQTGTADHIACYPGHLTITDLKYGEGELVVAEKNSQGMIYALGAFLRYDDEYHFETVTIRIAQPRLGMFTTYEVTRDELLEFGEFVRQRAKDAWKMNGPRRATPKGCRWCRVKASCPAVLMLCDALLEGRLEQIGRDYSHQQMIAFNEALEDGAYRVRPIDVSQLSTDALAKIAPYRRLIEQWFRGLDQHLEERAIGGEEVKGFKLVESRTNRAFKSDDFAIEAMEFVGLDDEDMYQKSLISPAQAIDALRNKFGMSEKRATRLLESAITKPPGRPVLAPLSDKRPVFGAYEADLWDDFADDEDDTEL